MLQELLATCQTMYNQVDKIEDVKICKVNTVEKKYYKVRWKCTWEPASILEKICGNKIKDYIQNHGVENTDVPDHNNNQKETATPNISETLTVCNGFNENVKNEHLPNIVTNNLLENKENIQQSICIIADANERLISQDALCINDNNFVPDLDIKSDTDEGNFPNLNIFSISNIATPNDIEYKLLEIDNMQKIHQNGRTFKDNDTCLPNRFENSIQNNVETEDGQTTCDSQFVQDTNSTFDKNDLIGSSLDIGNAIAEKEDLSQQQLTFHPLDKTMANAEFAATDIESTPIESTQNEIEDKLPENTNKQKTKLENFNIVAEDFQSAHDVRISEDSSSSLYRNDFVCYSLDTTKEISRKEQIDVRVTVTDFRISNIENGHIKEGENKMTLNTQSSASNLSHILKSKRKLLAEAPQEKDMTTSSPLKELIISDNSNSLVDRNNQTALNNFSPEAYDRLKQQVQHRRIGPTTSALVRPALPSLRPSPGAAMRIKPTKRRMKLDEDTDSDIISNSGVGKKEKKDLSTATPPEKPRRESQRNQSKLITKILTNMVDNIADASKNINTPKEKTKSLNDIKKSCAIRSAKQKHRTRMHFKCKMCSYSTKNQGYLKLHIRRHTGERKLKKQFDADNSVKLGKEMSEISMDKSSIEFNCREMSEISMDKSSKEFYCKLCLFTCVHKGALAIHSKIHSGVKELKHDKCSYTTARKSNLKLHLATHTGVKPYKCDQCSFSAVTRSHLKYHHATHTGVKPFKCDKCSFAAVTKCQLKYHVATHTGVKPYQCDRCSYATVRKGDLKLHLATHTGVKPYKCDKCSYTAVQKGHLKVHLATHTGVKP